MRYLFPEGVEGCVIGRSEFFDGITGSDSNDRDQRERAMQVASKEVIPHLGNDLS